MYFSSFPPPSAPSLLSLLRRRSITTPTLSPRSSTPAHPTTSLFLPLLSKSSTGPSFCPSTTGQSAKAPTRSSPLPTPVSVPLPLLLQLLLLPFLTVLLPFICLESPLFSTLLHLLFSPCYFFSLFSHAPCLCRSRTHPPLRQLFMVLPHFFPFF